MSYILDALKKLEHDKSRKSRGDGMINISGALFEHERHKSSGPAVRKIALAVTVAVLMTFGATWLFLQPGKGRIKPSARLAAPPPAPPIRVETAPAPPVPPAAPVQLTPPVATSAPAQESPSRPPVQPSKPQTAVVPSAPATEDDDAGRAPRRRTKERQGLALPADQAIAAPADIKLSGIAWQEEHRARRAVVNGFLMQEGGVVSGARITDIYQDRVRFTLSGKTFEIPLVSSAVPAAGK
jgi:type IV secretory pathway VirB10-like protein